MLLIFQYFLCLYIKNIINQIIYVLIIIVERVTIDAVLIFGGFGIPAMNVRGAAIATLISRIIELTVSVIVSYRPGYIHPYIGRLFKRNKQLAQDFRKCALPLLGACLFWGIGFTSYSSFMGHLGTDAAAANSVAAVVRDIICCFSAGISSAASCPRFSDYPNQVLVF